MHQLVQDPLTRIIAQVCAILMVTRVTGALRTFLRQPLVVAEIVAGILLGPSFLGRIWPSLLSTVFPADSLRPLQLMSQLGLILYMFLMGLELSPEVLRGRQRTSVLISHSGIVVPFVLGATVAYVLRQQLAPAGIPTIAFVLFLGAAMSVTAFPVLTRILTEQRLVQSPLGVLVIACAAVDDVTAWCVLAFVTAVVRATGVGSAVLTTALVFAYVALMFALRPLLRHVMPADGGEHPVASGRFSTLILLLLLSSWATELIGVHALFGAFVFGAVLPKGRVTEEVSRRFEAPVTVVLLPLFFAYTGLRTQVGLLDGEGWWLCGLLMLVACAGKFGGTFAAARLSGLSWSASGAIGTLMNTRGLMELIVLNLGADMGVISPRVFTMMVLVALMTTVATTPILRLICPSDGRLDVQVQRSKPAVELA